MLFILPLLLVLCVAYTAHGAIDDPLESPSITPFMESESFEQPILIQPEGADNDLVEISSEKIGRHNKSRKASAKKSEKMGTHRIHKEGEITPSQIVDQKPERFSIEHPFAKEIFVSLNKDLERHLSLQVDQLQDNSFESKGKLLFDVRS